MKKHLLSAIAFFALLIFLMLFEFWVIGIVQVNRQNFWNERHITEVWTDHFNKNYGGYAR